MTAAGVPVGTRVPDFECPGTGGPVSLKDFTRQPVVLYLYPKDNTPGCTRESQDFRDLHAEFRGLKAVVLGVSRDGLKSHEMFRTGQCLPFDLLVDEDERLCRLFGVIREKNMYGRKVRGIERSTFLIDGKGVLCREWRGVKVEGHAAEVLAAVREISGK